MTIQRFALAVTLYGLVSSISVASTLPITSGLVAQFQANVQTVAVDANDNVVSWTAMNDNSIVLSVGGTDDPANMLLSSTGMGGSPTIEVRDFTGDNRYLIGNLGLAANLTQATIFWLGYYQPERDGSLNDTLGQYAFSLGQADGAGKQMSHQTDDNVFELYDGGTTSAGPAIDYFEGQYTVFQTNFSSTSPKHVAFANAVDLPIGGTGTYNVESAHDLMLFAWQTGSGASGGYNFVGNMSELIIYDRVLTPAEALQVQQYLVSRVPEPSSIALGALAVLGAVLTHRRKK